MLTGIKFLKKGNIFKENIITMIILYGRDIPRKKKEM